MIILGMMSGTSVDGIDAVLVDIVGAPPQFEWKIIGHHQMPFPEVIRNEIFDCFDPKKGTVDRICSLNFKLGHVYGEAALETIQRLGFSPEQIRLIGCHGQTVWHIPANEPDASTLQLGDPSVISEITGLPVVSHFRNADMAAGGHGAPVVSFMDVMLLSDPKKVRAAQNIGGIGNVTFLPPKNREYSDSEPIAFDTGPGNMLIDCAVEQITGGKQHFDKDGKIAASGKINHSFLAQLLQNPYYRMKPPKTTGRELFGVQMGERINQIRKSLNISDADYVCTVTALTAETIAQAYRDFLPIMPDEVIVSGGGAKNPTLMRELTERLMLSKVIRIEELGIASEAKEATAFALMAYETWHRRIGNIPSATGAKHPVVMGNITWAPLKPERISENISPTEARNPATADMDRVSTLALVQEINEEDQKVADAVAAVLPKIAASVDAIVSRMKQGGRMIYLGAGTSGRLGVLDASEVLPTFSVSPDLVIGKIAGGPDALTKSIENAEDDPVLGASEIIELKVTEKDSVIGIAASGNTPYVLGALEKAQSRKALTIGIACNPAGKITRFSDIAILPVVGPEALTGSTRMKAGTAQKMVLNMLSTAVMVRMGKTYSNLMVDVQPSNQKLIDRQRRIVAEACGIDQNKAEELLSQCNREAKTAIVVQKTGLSPDEARLILSQNDGFVEKSITSALSRKEQSSK